MGGHYAPPPPPSNFVASCSIIIKFGIVIEFDTLSPKSPKIFLKMKSLPSYDVLFCLRLLYPFKSRNSLFGPELAQIWFRRRILGGDLESEMIFYIRGQYQVNIGHFLQVCLRKSDGHSLTIWLLWQ